MDELVAFFLIAGVIVTLAGLVMMLSPITLTTGGVFFVGGIFVTVFCAILMLFV